MDEATFEKAEQLNMQIRSLKSDIDAINEIKENPENIREINFMTSKNRHLNLSPKYMDGKVVFSPVSALLTKVLGELKEQYIKQLNRAENQFEAL